MHIRDITPRDDVYCTS